MKKLLTLQESCDNLYKLSLRDTEDSKKNKKVLDNQPTTLYNTKVADEKETYSKRKKFLTNGFNFGRISELLL